jgi:hypothetical protein
MKIPSFRRMTAAGAMLAVALPFAGLAGIQGSGFRSLAIVEPVTSISSGTVSVGGVPYNDSGATVEVDGQAGSVSQLRVGDVITAYGHLGNGDNPGVIERLILNHSVRATVQSVDAANGTFTAAGQTVQVNAQTVLDPTLALVGLTALVPGAKVQVSGWPDSTGEIVASRIDVLALGSTQVTGRLASLDSARHRFTINQLTVDFTGAQVEGVIQEGSDVLVSGKGFDRTGALLAQQVELVQPLQVAAGETGRLQGIVTALTSSTNFEVNGQPVEVTAATKLNLHGPVALNAKVKAAGVFDANGVLVVSELQTKKK